MTFPSLRFAKIDDRREDSIRTLEGAYNVKFEGIQDMITHFSLTLTDNITHSSIQITDLRDIPERLRKLRAHAKT